MYLKMLTAENAATYGHLVPDAYLSNPDLLGVVCLDEDLWDQAVGSAVVEVGASSMILRYLFVIPSARRSGVGTMLMEGIRDMCAAADIHQIETWIWEEFDTDFGEEIADGAEEAEKEPEDEKEEPEGETVPEAEIDDADEDEEDEDEEEGDDSEELELFLLQQGFVNLREHPIYSYRLRSLLESPYLSKLKPVKGFEDYTSRAFDGITDRQKQFVRQQILKKGYADYIPYCRKDLSYIAMKDDKITGCILTADDPERQVLAILLLRNFTKDQACVVRLLAALKKGVSEALSQDYTIAFLWSGQDITGMMEKVLGGEENYNLLGYTAHGICDLD